MHKTLSLGYTRSETEDCKKKIFFAAKNGGYTPGGYASGITVYGVCNVVTQNSEKQNSRKCESTDVLRSLEPAEGRNCHSTLDTLQ